MSGAQAGWWIAILLSGASLATQGKRELAPTTPFQGTLAEARSLAADRNVPLLCAVIYEDDAWDPQAHHDQVELREALLEDRELAAVLERAIVALGCNRIHPLETVEVGQGDQKRTVRRCPSFHTDSCSAHQRLFEDAYAAWNTDGALVSPHVVLLAPDGEISMRRSDGSSPTAKELRAAVDRAQKAAGPGLTAAEHSQVLGLCADGRTAAERKLPGSAWRAWNGVLAITQNTCFAQEARAGSDSALKTLETLRDEALAEVAQGRPVEGYRLLSDLLEAAAGTPLERDLGKLVRALEADKQHHDAIHAYKREREAEASMAEIEALLSAGDERRAGAKLRGMLRRYAGTAAATRARARWPELAGGA